MRNHVPVTILTGFLGSGKTTLLNRVLRENQGVRFALIINEFGEVGLDGGLIQKSPDFVKMDNGCLCCVLNEELEKTLHKLKERDDYDAVILETTGIADPLPIAWTFLRPQFGEGFRFAGIVTVVDALHLDKMLQQASETRLQIERADYVYLAKTDLCDPRQISSVAQKVATINPGARLVFSTDPDCISLLFADEVCLQPLDPGVHAHGFQSLTILLDQQRVSLNKFEVFFETLPAEVFRAKAVFRDEDNRIIVMHAVCGRVDFYEMPDYQGPLAAVLIGKGMDENLRQVFFNSLF